MRKMRRSHPFEITIREGLIKFIEEKYKDNNTLNYKNKKLKKDLIIYLMFYLIRLTEEEGEFIYVSSKLLKKNFLDNYKPYLSFWEDHIFIIHAKNYSAGNNPNGYGITNEYFDFEKRIIRYSITDTNLLAKINYNNSGLTKHELKKNKECIRRRKHLVKYFDNNLEIDVNEAYKEIASLDNKKYDANSYLIEEYQSKQWKYSIKKSTDDRLHTVISRTNKKLLKYITYDKQKLGEIDFKSSQPLFLFIIMNTIFIGAMENNVGRFLKKKLGTKLLEKIKRKGIDLQELKSFGDVIINKDLYNYLGENLKSAKSSERFSYYDHKKKMTIYFESKRDLMKVVMMRTLYSNENNDVGVQDVKKLFISIFEIVKVINENEKLSNSKNNLSHVLQSIEAHVILDLIAKDVSEEFKNIPLFSKHDSLITYKSSIDEVKNFVQCKFENYTGIKNGQNILKSEIW